MQMVKRNKLVLLSLLIMLPTLTVLSSLITNVQGGPYVPEQHPDNGWHWEVDVGDHMYFEGEFILSNASTGEIFMMWKDLWIYNITSIENVTLNWLGVHEFSQVNASQCYYNVSDDEFESYGYESEIALFGYNSSDAITHRIRAGQNGMPFLLPINGSNGLEADVMDDIINQTFYYPMGQGGFNKFDYYESTPISNRIYFHNSTHDFFSEGFYYDNGTLNIGTAYLMVEMGDGPVLINATMTQVFDHDMTNEVTWGVNTGDLLYYDGVKDELFVDDAMEYQINITGFTNVLLNKTKNSFNTEYPIQMAYEAVIADISEWNGTEYIITNASVPIGLANNFYASYFDEYGPMPFNFVYPTSAGIDDYKFMWNNDSLRIWNIPFDEVIYTENGFIETLVRNSTGFGYVETIVEKSTGIVHSMFMLDSHGMNYFQLKSQTLVDWSVNIGDSIYVKDNGEEAKDMKITIEETHTVYVNMTALLADYSSMGIPITLPVGQPEFQFFSYIEALYEIWDPSTESWIFDDYNILAIANIYWPISPLSFQFGPPIIMPEGTTSSELSAIFDFFGPVYDVITYNPDHVVLRNTTLSRELNFYFDSISGRVTMMSGWVNTPGPGSEWSYMSLYPKFYRSLAPGTHSFTVTNDFPTGITVQVDLEVGPVGAGVEYLYNFFPANLNPVNISLPNGTIIAYFDQLFTHFGTIAGNITMTLTLPSSINVTNIIPLFYAYNMSGSLDWSGAPSSFYDESVILDAATNSIILHMNKTMFSKGIISGLSYVLIEEVLQEIPGYDIFLMSFLVIIVSALIIRKRRKKF